MNNFDTKKKLLKMAAAKSLTTGMRSSALAKTNSSKILNGFAKIQQMDTQL